MTSPTLPFRPLGLVLGDQRVDQFAQPRPGDDLRQLLQREADPVVGHAALREVVGADAFGAVAGADHRLARLGLGPLRGVALLFVEARAQHLHRLFAVLVLAAPVLAGDHQPGRQVGDADRRIGRVDVLPARAGCAIGVDLEVARIDLHIDLVRLWQHRHGRRGGVDAPAALGLGHTLSLNPPTSDALMLTGSTFQPCSPAKRSYMR